MTKTAMKISQNTALFLFCISYSWTALSDVYDEQSSSNNRSASQATRDFEASDSGRATRGKPAPPIDLRLMVKEPLTLGVPVSVAVEIDTPVNNGNISIDYRILGDRRKMLVDADSRSATEPGRNDINSAIGAVTLTAQSAGRIYLQVTATVHTVDGTISKSQVFPLQVGESGPALETNGELIQSPNGEWIISMSSE